MDQKIQKISQMEQELQQMKQNAAQGQQSTEIVREMINRGIINQRPDGELDLPASQLDGHQSR